MKVIIEGNKVEQTAKISLSQQSDWVWICINGIEIASIGKDGRIGRCYTYKKEKKALEDVGVVFDSSCRMEVLE